MCKSPEKKKSTKFANLDMDKYKFDFNLFVPSEKENNKPKGEKPANK